MTARHRAAGTPGPLAGNPDAAEQLVEARIGADGVEEGVCDDVQEAGLTPGVALIEPPESVRGIARGGIKRGRRERALLPLPRARGEDICQARQDRVRIAAAQRLPHLAHRRCSSRPEELRPFVHRLVAARQQPEREPDTVVEFPAPREETGQFPALLDHLVVVACRVRMVEEDAARRPERRVEAEHASDLLEAARGVAGYHQVVGVGVPDHGRIGIHPDRLAQRLPGAGEIPVPVQRHVGDDAGGFGQRGIEREGALRSVARLRQNVRGGIADEGLRRCRQGKANPGRRERRVVVQRLAIEPGGGLQPLAGEREVGVPAPEVGINDVGPDRAGGRAGHRGRFLRHRQLDLASDGPGEFRHEAEHVRRRALVAVRPQMVVVRRANQLHVDEDPVTRPQDRPFDHGVHLQLAGNVRQRRGLAPVTHRRRARPHLEAARRRAAGQLGDERVVNAVGEVVLLVRARRAERADLRAEAPGTLTPRLERGTTG